MRHRCLHRIASHYIALERVVLTGKELECDEKREKCNEEMK